MNKTIKILLIIGGLLVVSYPGTAWLMGLVVEHHIEHAEQQLSHQAPYIALVKRRYDRGVYRSTEVVTYRIHDPLLLQRKSGQPALSHRTFTVTVRNIIRHGPFPGLRSAGLATIDSTLQLSSQAQRQLSELLGSKPIVQVHTIIDWLANTQSRITIPAFSWQAPNGSSFVWNGLTGVVDTGGNFSSWSGHINVPQLNVRTHDGGHLTLLGLGFSGHGQKAFDAFFAGRNQFKILQLTSRDPHTGRTIALHHIAVTSTTDVHGNFLDAHFNASVDASRFGTISLSHIVYSVAFDHLHGPTLSQLSRALHAAERDTSATSAQITARVQQALRQYGAQLLLHNPVFKIRKASFTMPDGTLVLSGSARSPGLSSADLRLPNLISALKAHARVTAHLRIDNALLQKFITTRGHAAVLAARVTALEQHGYLTSGARSVTTQLRYDDGQLTLNNKPLLQTAPAN